jgi:hypothetical protein
MVQRLDVAATVLDGKKNQPMMECSKITTMADRFTEGTVGGGSAKINRGWIFRNYREDGCRNFTGDTMGGGG